MQLSSVPLVNGLGGAASLLQLESVKKPSIRPLNSCSFTQQIKYSEIILKVIYLLL